MTTPTPCGLEHVVDRARDLLGQALLHLEAAREHLDDARAACSSPTILPFGMYAMCALPEERQHVVLAEPVELDVAHHDHVGAPSASKSAIADHLRDVHLVAARQPGERLRDALRRPQQPFAVRIFAEQLELAANEVAKLVVRAVIVISLLEPMFPLLALGREC